MRGRITVRPKGATRGKRIKRLRDTDITVEVGTIVDACVAAILAAPTWDVRPERTVTAVCEPFRRLVRHAMGADFANGAFIDAVMSRLDRED